MKTFQNFFTTSQNFFVNCLWNFSTNFFAISLRNFRQTLWKSGHFFYNFLQLFWSTFLIKFCQLFWSLSCKKVVTFLPQSWALFDPESWALSYPQIPLQTPPRSPSRPSKVEGETGVELSSILAPESAHFPPRKVLKVEGEMEPVPGSPRTGSRPLKSAFSGPPLLSLFWCGKTPYLFDVFGLSPGPGLGAPWTPPRIHPGSTPETTMSLWPN